MKIGFFCQSPAHLWMAALMLQSVRESMPGVEVHHLTDKYCQALDGVDGVMRVEAQMPMAVRRMTAQAACEGDWLFIDSDVLIKKDVAHVFDDKGFDVALTDRAGTITTEAKYAAVMPQNIGVVFSRSPAFWEAVKGHLLKLPEEYQQWEGDQRIVCEMVKLGGQGFSIKIIPGMQYNYPPRSIDDERMANAAILHYKGNRKQWLTSPTNLSAA